MGVFRRQYVPGIIKGEGHLCHLLGLTVTGTVKDHILHLVRAEITGLLFAKHPSYGIYHIRLTTAVGAYNTGNALVEVNNHAVSETFEALYL
jgi:hypothetical protein